MILNEISELNNHVPLHFEDSQLFHHFSRLCDAERLFVMLPAQLFVWVISLIYERLPTDMLGRA